MSIAALLDISGEVRRVDPRTVPERPAREAGTDESGTFRPAVEHRDGYEVVDLTVLTDDGGFATVLLGAEVLTALAGSIPVNGDRVSYKVRTFIAWRSQGSRKYPAVGLSVSADHLATTSGARRADAA